MKITNLVLTCAVFATALGILSYDSGWAGAKPEPTAPKIAVVRVRDLFQNCVKNTEYQKKAVQEEEKIKAELEKLAREIDALKADLNTRKAGSSDYIDLMQNTLNKQAQYQAKKEFHQQELALKDQRWTEQLYTDILNVVTKVAGEKGIDLVFAKDQLDFPANSPTELMLAIRTHKLLYSVGTLDITDDVLAVLNTKQDADRESAKEGKRN